MIGVMLYLNWRFTLIALRDGARAVCDRLYRYTRRIKQASRAVRKEKVSSVESRDALTSIRVVKAFAREDYEERRFASESLANVEAGLQARSVKAKLAPAGRGHRRRSARAWCSGTARAWRSPRQFTARPLIMFLSYLANMYKPMRDLSKMSDTVSKAVVGYERMRRGARHGKPRP